VKSILISHCHAESWRRIKVLVAVSWTVGLICTVSEQNGPISVGGSGGCYRQLPHVYFLTSSFDIYSDFFLWHLAIVTTHTATIYKVA
jgi:hypothetical protein